MCQWCIMSSHPWKPLPWRAMHGTVWPKDRLPMIKRQTARAQSSDATWPTTCYSVVSLTGNLEACPGCHIHWRNIAMSACHLVNFLEGLDHDSNDQEFSAKEVDRELNAKEVEQKDEPNRFRSIWVHSGGSFTCKVLTSARGKLWHKSARSPSWSARASHLLALRHCKHPCKTGRQKWPKKSNVIVNRLFTYCGLHHGLTEEGIKGHQKGLTHIDESLVSLGTLFVEKQPRLCLCLSQ